MRAAALNGMARCSRVELTSVTEGSTTVRVPADQAEGGRGPGEAGQGFYNPAMALTRDLDVLAARALDPPNRPGFLDGLAATGIRGLRVACEADGWLVTLNDRSRSTARVAEANVDRLAMGERAVVRSRDVNALLAEGSWAFVDIDPYGSPAPFASMAMLGVEDGGLLAVTATDTTALHGVKAKPARRRYKADPPPRESPGWKAAASRLLVGSMIRDAARHDRAAEPVLVHHHQHVVRAYLRIREGAQRADEALEKLERVALCPACHGWGTQTCPCGAAEATGPYAMGPLNDVEVLEAMAEEVDDGLAAPEHASTLLGRLADEARLGPFYLDVDRAVDARELGGPPAREDLREALADAGIETARTHYGPTTLAHDGEPERVLEVLDRTARRA